jgi:hypothetical protein
VRAITATTLNVGDSINVTFDVRISTPATPNVGDRIFRFGLYNSTAANTGYTGRLDTGTPAPNTFDVFPQQRHLQHHDGLAFVLAIAHVRDIQRRPPSTTTACDTYRSRCRAMRRASLRASPCRKGSNTPVTISNGTANAAPSDSYYTLDRFIVGFNGTAGGPGQAGRRRRRSTSITS